MSAVWTNLEGHVINGVLPLHRCIASSDHSAVFITESAKHASSAVALKLVRIDPALADAQLSLWVAAADLSHPHLIRIFEAGQCHIGGLHCLYALMEYADQNLAQLLEQRVLVENEVREMLVPTLSALAYLHERKLGQGQLKPSNILAVGDQLKLASDTVRTVGGSANSTNAGSVYDAPEARDGIYSAAGDIWALGVTMCEALTRRQPSGVHDGVEVELPFNLHPPFREIVARCLSSNPRDRPGTAELHAWLQGEHNMTAVTATTQRGKISSPTSAMSEHATDRLSSAERVAASTATAEHQSTKPSTFRLVIRAEIIPEKNTRTTTARQPLKRRALLFVLGALAVLMLSWVGARVFRTEPASPPAASEGTRGVQSQLPVTVPAPSAAATVVAEPPSRPATSSIETESAETKSAKAKSIESAVRDEPDAPSPVNEVIPDVPRSARQTIRGTIRVSIRVVINEQGTVVAATADEPGPSRYFERLAIDASRKWTFSPADTEEQRIMLVRFNFTRGGTTARANPLQ